MAKTVPFPLNRDYGIMGDRVPSICQYDFFNPGWCHVISCHVISSSCFMLHNRPEVTAPHRYPVFFCWGNQSWGFIDQQLWHLIGTLHTQPNAQFHDTWHISPNCLIYCLKQKYSIQGEYFDVLCLLPSAPCKSSITAASSIYSKPSKTHRFITYREFFEAQFFPYYKSVSIGISVQLRTKQNCSVFHDSIASRRFPCFVDVSTFLNLGFVAATSCIVRGRIHRPSHHHKKMLVKLLLAVGLVPAFFTNIFTSSRSPWGGALEEIPKIPCWRPLDPSWVVFAPPNFWGKIRNYRCFPIMGVSTGTLFSHMTSWVPYL